MTSNPPVWFNAAVNVNSLALVLLLQGAMKGGALAQVLAPVLVQTNTTIRVMAANLSSGNNQRYEAPGRNIMKGLKPDVVAIQEFNYISTVHGLNTPEALREMVDQTFGTNFVYCRESGKSIPNGVISRYSILTNGVWDDPQLTDRDFIWALLDIPGSNDLYVVSVHLHSGGGASSRAIEASTLKTRIQGTFPTNAYVILAGDFNTDSRSESAMTTFKTFLSDNPIPNDGTAARDPDTNASREKPYDYVLPSFSLNSNHVATVIGSRTFPNGLVFDSRVYTNLSDVAPVQLADSGASQMQHMAVVKDFRVQHTLTNYVAVPGPRLTLSPTNVLRWAGLSNVTYRVQTSTTLTNWFSLGTATSTTTNVSFTNVTPEGSRLFYRVVYP